MTQVDSYVRNVPLSPEPEVYLSDTQSSASEHSDLRDFVSLLRRHVLLIAAVTILTGAATYFVTAQEAKHYVSGATLLYASGSSAEDPTRAVDTLVGISSSSAVLSPVATRSGMTLGELNGALSVSGDTNADLIHISVTLGSPTQATGVANRVAKALIAYSATGQKDVLRAQIASLQHQLTTFAGRTDPSSLAAASDLRTQLAQAKAQLAVSAPPLSVLTPAVTPSGPVSPHPKRDGAIGLLVGLVLGVMLGALRDRLDRRIRGIEEVEAIYRAPTLGIVPFAKTRYRAASRSTGVADFSSPGALADAYRTIRTNLTLLQLDENKPSVVVVTSATAEEGKSTVVANLAQALSVTGRDVLAVSADLHNPTLHEYFSPWSEKHESRSAAGPAVRGASGKSHQGLTRSRRWAEPRMPGGLVPVLAGDVALSDAIRIVPLSAAERERGGSLHLLADSRTFFDPAVLLSSSAMRDFLDQSRKDYDVIVLDTPPLLANADATLLAQDAVLVIVARLDHVTKNQARRAVQVMASTHLAPTGIIVTGEVDEPVYGYGYRIEYGSGASGNGADGRAGKTV